MSKKHGKKSTKRKGNHREDDEIVIIDTATQDDMVVIDTSALDKEIAEGESNQDESAEEIVILPIRGRNQDNEDNNDALSMFLQGKCKKSEVKNVSLDDIKETLADQDLVSLGKFLQQNPEMLKGFITESKSKKKGNNKMINQSKYNLSKKDVKKLRELITETVESLDEKFSVKVIFNAIKDKLGVNIAKIITNLIDKLDNFNEDEFINFIDYLKDELKDTKFAKVLEYFCGKDLETIIEAVVTNDDKVCKGIYHTAEEKFNKILNSGLLDGTLSKKFKSENELIAASVTKIIDIIDEGTLENIEKRQHQETKDEDVKNSFIRGSIIETAVSRTPKAKQTIQNVNKLRHRDIQSGKQTRFKSFIGGVC